MESKNWLVLKDFIAYCVNHPEMRFWQALRNWSTFHYILGANPHPREKLTMDDLVDTFYFEGKDQ